MILKADGSFYQKYNCFYLLYTTQDEDSGAKDNVLLKISEDAIIMKRSGVYSSEMHFVQSEKTKCQYNTPYGAMEMEVWCQKSTASLSENGGKIQIEYLLQIGSDAYKNKLVIQVKAGKENQ